MAALQASTRALSGVRASTAGPRAVLPVRRPSSKLVVRAQAGQNELTAEVSKVLALSTAAATFLAAGNASAATEVAQLAGSDSRVAIIGTLLVPALGWVAFNVGQAALNQLGEMNAVAASGPSRSAAPSKKALKKRSVAGIVGLGAATSMLMADQADAATELAQLAASDNRVFIIGTLLLPALGWVAFNIGAAALNQLGAMNEEAKATVGKTSAPIKKGKGRK